MANCGTITVDGDGGNGGDEPGDDDGDKTGGILTLAILGAVAYVGYKQFGGSK